MVYDPEPKEAGSPGAHPEAGQGEGGNPQNGSRRVTAASSDRNARRRAQRAAAKTAKQHQASTGRDLDFSGTDRSETGGEPVGGG